MSGDLPNLSQQYGNNFPVDETCVAAAGSGPGEELLAWFMDLKYKRNIRMRIERRTRRLE